MKYISLIFLTLLACDGGEAADDDAPGGSGHDAATRHPDGGRTDGGRSDAGPTDPTWVGPGIRVYWEGDNVLFVVRQGAAIFSSFCEKAFVLEKREGDTWVAARDDRPSVYDNPGYFLDGEYVPAKRDPECDRKDCYELGGPYELSPAVEYVKTGTKDAPEGSNATKPVLDTIERRPLNGKLRARVSYARQPDCSDEAAVEVELTVPEGLCCPVGSAGCSSEGPRGGWAPSLETCRPGRPGFDEYVEIRQDVRGCSALVANEEICCGCSR